MKEAVTKVIDTLAQEDFHVAFQKLLERYNKCIAAGGDYFEEDKSFQCVLSIKVPIRKKVWKLIVCTSYVIQKKSSVSLVRLQSFPDQRWPQSQTAWDSNAFLPLEQGKLPCNIQSFLSLKLIALN